MGKSSLKKSLRRVICNRQLISILILILILATVYIFVRPLLKPKPKQTVSQLATSTTKNISNGKTGTATKELESFVNSNASQQEKLSAFIFLALTYRTQGRKDDALKAISNAEKINKDIGYSGFSLAASIYEERGEKSKAIEYYQKAVTSMQNSPEKSDDLYIEQFTKKIKELSQ